MLILLELMRYLLNKQIALDIDVAEPELHNDGRTGPDPNISERVGDRQGTGLCVIEFQKGLCFCCAVCGDLHLVGVLQKAPLVDICAVFCYKHLALTAFLILKSDLDLVISLAVDRAGVAVVAGCVHIDTEV